MQDSLESEFSMLWVAFVIWDSYRLLKESANVRYLCEEPLFRTPDIEAVLRIVDSPEEKGKLGDVATKVEHSSMN